MRVFGLFFLGVLVFFPKVSFSATQIEALDIVCWNSNTWGGLPHYNAHKSCHSASDALTDLKEDKVFFKNRECHSTFPHSEVNICGKYGADMAPILVVEDSIFLNSKVYTFKKKIKTGHIHCHKNFFKLLSTEAFQFEVECEEDPNSEGFLLTLHLEKKSS